MTIVTQHIKGASTDQCFKGTTIDHTLIDTATKIKQIFKWSARFAHLHNINHSRFARALHCTQTISHGLIIYRRKTIIRTINIRRQHYELLHDGVVVIAVHFVGIVHIGRQRGGHERSWVMRFEVGSLIGNQRVGSRVRFVKTVTGELFHQVKQLCGQRLLDLALDRTLDKKTALLRHLFQVFLTHRTPQNVRSAKGIAADDLCNLHHLLLIHNDAVGWLKRHFQVGVEIIGLSATMFTVDKIFHHA